MSSSDKNEAKKNKLCLRKKTIKNVQEIKQDKAVFHPASIDLNETCEFTSPATFKSVAAAGLSGKQKKVIKSGEKGIPTSADSGSSGQVEEVTCQVCNKSLTHMSTTGRHQHVNRCIDESIGKDRAEKEHQELLEKARTATLDCPMCGKAFKSDTARLSHVKKCSRELGVSTDQLLKLRKDQEADRQAMLAKGVLPDSLRNLKVKPSVPSKKRKAKEPKSQYEEDVQVAMAISSSLAEQEKQHTADVKNHLPDTDGSNKGKISKRGKKKTVYEEVCLLTTLSDTDRQRRLEEKVSNILQQEDSVECEGMKMTLLASDLAAAPHTHDKETSLWARCGQALDDCPVERLYVGQLVPPVVISRSSPGSKARKRVHIPGREVTFIEEKPSTAAVQSLGINLSGGEDIITASTQTAVVLAELAMEEEDTSIHCSEETARDTSILAGTQSMGFCLQTLTMKEEDKLVQQRGALEAYGGLVNSPDYSDVTITTTDGQSLHAHKLILMVRCPKLIQMVDSSSRVKLDCTTDTALSLLQYIYTGELTLTTAVTEIKHLAKQLELLALEQVCDNLVAFTEGKEESESMDEGIAKHDLSTQNISEIDLKEIWGESDSSEVDDVDPECVDSGEVDEEDYREIMCTQRRQVRASSSDKGHPGGDEVEKMTDTEGNVDGYVDKDIEYNSDQSVKQSDKVETKRYKVCDKLGKAVCDMGNVTGETPDTDSVVRSLKCQGSDKDESRKKHDIIQTKSGNYVDCSIVLSSDDELIPSPKRARLFDDSMDKTDSSRDEIPTQANDSLESTEISTEALSCLQRQDKASVETSVNQSHSSLNQSGSIEFSVNQSHSSLNQSGSVEISVNQSHSRQNQSVNQSHSSLNQSGSVEFSVNQSPSSQNQSVNQSHRSLKLSVNQSHSSLNQSRAVEFSVNQSNSNLDESGADLFCSPSPVKQSREAEQQSSSVVLGRTAKDSIVVYDSDTEVVNEDNDISATSIGRTKTANTSADSLGDVCDKSRTSHDSSVCSINPRNITTEYDDDLEITGDNFTSLSQAASPVFKDKRTDKSCRSSEGSQSSVHANRFREDWTEVEEAAHVRENVAESDHLEESIDLDHDVNLENSQTYKANTCESAVNCDKNKLLVTSKETIIELGIDDKHGDGSSDVDADKDRGDSVDKESVELCIDDKDGDDSFDMDTDKARGASVGKDSEESESTSPDSATGYEEIRMSELDSETSHLEAANAGITELKSSDLELQDPDDANRDMETDVWDDFNDDGMGFVLPVESPESPANLGDGVTDSAGNTSFPDGEDSFVFHVDLEKEEEAKTTASSQSKTRFVTPTIKQPVLQKKKKEEEKDKKQHPWVPPSPFTPMPEYDKMATPALKKAVHGFGVKPVGKKRMVKVLTDIYHQTHQYETDSECETAADMDMDDSEEDSDVASSQQSTQDSSEMGDVFEESCLHMISSDSDTASSPQKGVDVTKQIFDYFKKNPVLHKRVLLYEPLELDMLKKDLKEAKIKCSMDKLMDFLDDRCIAFTTKNSRGSRRGRQKKRSPKKAAAAKSPKKQTRARPKKSKTDSLS